MTLSLLREGDRAVMLCYLGAPRLDRVPGGIAVVISSEGVTDTTASLAAARKLAGLPDDAPTAVCGYSAGCQPVRALLLAGGPELADAWVTIDGTADSYPVMQPARIEAWRGLAAAARTRHVLWVATCIQQDYVEHLPEKPFAATKRVLAAATGLDTSGPMTRPPSGVKQGGGYTGKPADVELAHRYVEGCLVVEAYGSSHTDAAEHAAQAQVVYPRLVEEVVAPWLLERRRPAGESPGFLSRLVATGRSMLSGLMSRSVKSLGERALEVAKAEHARGVREFPGAQHNPAIQAYIAGARRGGEPTAGYLGVTGPVVLGPSAPDETEWCASAASWCLSKVLRDGDAAPHGWRCSVRELVEDARLLGTWRDISSGYRPAVGDLAILRRVTGADPRTGGQGHVARVSKEVEQGLYATLGGNEGNEWRYTMRAVDDGRTVGWIVYGRP